MIPYPARITAASSSFPRHRFVTGDAWVLWCLGPGLGSGTYELESKTAHRYSKTCFSGLYVVLVVNNPNNIECSRSHTDIRLKSDCCQGCDLSGLCDMLSRIYFFIWKLTWIQCLRLQPTNILLTIIYGSVLVPH